MTLGLIYRYRSVGAGVVALEGPKAMVLKTCGAAHSDGRSLRSLVVKHRYPYRATL